MVIGGSSVVVVLTERCYVRTLLRAITFVQYSIVREYAIPLLASTEGTEAEKGLW